MCEVKKRGCPWKEEEYKGKGLVVHKDYQVSNCSAVAIRKELSGAREAVGEKEGSASLPPFLSFSLLPSQIRMEYIKVALDPPCDFHVSGRGPSRNSDPNSSLHVTSKPILETWKSDSERSWKLFKVPGVLMGSEVSTSILH